MTDLIDGLKSVDGGRCAGVLYWDPCMIHVEDPENENESLSGWAISEKDDKPAGNVVENTTLFDFDGVALPTVNVFKKAQGIGGILSGQVTEDDENVTAQVTNTTNETKKANLYVVTYNAAGVLESVEVDSKDVQKGEALTLTIRKPAKTYRVFLWDGETLSPISK